MRPLHVLVLAALAASCASAPRPTSPVTPAAKPEPLADCLARRGARLYGASWCEWCHVQLKKFGSDASRVPYTDCDPEGTLELKAECLDKGEGFVSKFPVWLFADGSRLYGVRSLQAIALVAGCPVPP